MTSDRSRKLKKTMASTVLSQVGLMKASPFINVLKPYQSIAIPQNKQKSN